jgi:hypothetical protein
MIDINDPKVRWAQQIADKTGFKQVIISNAVGGLDIKRESAVNLIFNESVQAIIEPSCHRIPFKFEEFARLKRGINLCTVDASDINQSERL